MLEICQTFIFNDTVLNCYDDHTAVLANVDGVFLAPKLQHVNKFYRISVTSTCLAFYEPNIDAEYADILIKWDSAIKPFSDSVVSDLKH